MGDRRSDSPIGRRRLPEQTIPLHPEDCVPRPLAPGSKGGQTGDSRSELLHTGQVIQNTSAPRRSSPDYQSTSRDASGSDQELTPCPQSDSQTASESEEEPPSYHCSASEDIVMHRYSRTVLLQYQESQNSELHEVLLESRETAMLIRSEITTRAGATTGSSTASCVVRHPSSGDRDLPWMACPQERHPSDQSSSNRRQQGRRGRSAPKHFPCPAGAGSSTGSCPTTSVSPAKEDCYDSFDWNQIPCHGGRYQLTFSNRTMKDGRQGEWPTGGGGDQGGMRTEQQGRHGSRSSFVTSNTRTTPGVSYAIQTTSGAACH